MTRVRLQHGGAELDRGGRAAGERHRDERVAEHGARVPEAREPVGFGVHRLLDDAVGGRSRRL